MVSKEEVMVALKKCYDPEIPVNIVDLGLVYGVSIKDGAVEVEMTLTAPGCPMGSVIARQAKEAVQGLKGVTRADVRIVWEPLWTPERMTSEAKKMLGLE